MIDIAELYARNIGKQIQNLQRIYCPRCAETYGCDVEAYKQPLIAFGDMEENLICPHCELSFYIKTEVL